MKILHTVEFYDPGVGGSQEVVRQLSEGMARTGHEVTVATMKLAGQTRQPSIKAADMAAAIEEMMRNHSRHQLALNGFQTWSRQFTWELLVGSYEQLYRQLVCA